MLHREDAKKLRVVLLEADRIGDDAGFHARRRGAAGLDVERAAATFDARSRKIDRIADAAQELDDRRDEMRRPFANRAAEHERARDGRTRDHLVREIAPQFQDDVYVVDVRWTDGIAVAAERAGPDRLDHLFGNEARLQRLVAAASGQHVESRFLVRRASEDTEPTADAVAEIEIRLHRTRRRGSG